MHIVILGAGSVGLLFGGLLHQAGQSISYITRSKEQARQLDASGVKMMQQTGEEYHFWARAFAIGELHRPAVEALWKDVDIVIICVKQTQLEEVVSHIYPHVPKEKPLLFLMNGMGHQEVIEEALNHRYVYYGITQRGATRVSPVQVHERGIGKTLIGCRRQEGELHTKRQTGGDGGERIGSGSIGAIDVHPSIQQLIVALQQHSGQTEWADALDIYMLRKCIVNACINPLTAVHQVTNGELITQPQLHGRMYELYLELEGLYDLLDSVMKEKVFQNGYLWQEIEAICRNTRDNHSSMLQDIQHGRATEIDSITGYFLQLARRIGHDLPVHQYVYDTITTMQTN